MKKPAILLAAFGLTLIGTLHAQTVPLFFNYQGKITTSGGVPLGATGTAPDFVPAPINRKMIFRIYDAASAGTVIWSEQQTVTVTMGEFSVLLGQGTASTWPVVPVEPRPALDTVFNATGTVTPAGPLRYLEIVVDDGSGTFTSPADAPIVPRQRLTTTAYAFRARMADTVPNLAITSAALADGAVTGVKILDSAITSLKIGDAQVTSAKILDSSITSAKIADGNVGTAELTNAAVTAAKLDPTIGVWNAATGNVSRPTGFVGIGKTPTVPLDVVGAINATGNITTTGALVGASITTTGNFGAANITATGGVRALGGVPNVSSTTGFSFTGGGGDPDSGMFSTGAGLLQFYADSVERMRINTGGFVGIGRTNPLAPLHVGGSAVSPSFTLEGYVDTNGAGDTQIFNFTPAIGIIADSAMRASSFYVVSDARIKKNLSLSNGATDLATLMDVEVTDYTFKDVIANGSSPQKRVIAQQVEKVYPQAVSQSTSVVPDIFQKARFKDGWVTLATDLKPGERVRLMGAKGEGVQEVLEVAGDRFRTAFATEGDTVFVYGREVKDFRTVDYDAIAMLNVSATQQLKKENDALTKKVAAQDQRIAELEARDTARETKLAAIEKLLQTAVSTGSSPRTASLNTGAAAK